MGFGGESQTTLTIIYFRCALTHSRSRRLAGLRVCFSGHRASRDNPAPGVPVGSGMAVALPQGSFSPEVALLGEFVSIVICTHNRCALVAQAVASLHQVSVPQGHRAELVVVLNGCTDSTAAAVATAAADLPMPVRLVEEPILGLSVARNRAVAESGGGIIAMLDDDVIVSPGWLEALIDAYESTGAGMVAGRVKLWWGTLPRPSWFDPALDGLLSECDHGPKVKRLFGPFGSVGANLSFRRDTFRGAGPFRVGLGRSGRFMLTAEDADFMFRALDAETAFFYAPQAAVAHVVTDWKADPRYLARIAFGVGASGVFMKKKIGVRQILRTAVGHAYLLFSGAIMVAACWAAGQDRGVVRSRCRMACGCGGLGALWTRIMGRSPVA